MTNFSKTSYKDFVFLQSDFLRLVGAPNESFGKTNDNDFIFAQSDFLKLVGALNESFRLITLYYMFKYSFQIKSTLLESHGSQNYLGKIIYKNFVFAKSDF